MRNIFIVIFILSICSFSSFGSPSGKGIVCECLKPKCKTIFGFEFFDKTVVQHGFEKVKDHIKISKFREIKYQLDDKHIYWWFKDTGYFELNRKNLKLDYDDGKKIYKCEVFSQKKYKDELNKYKNKYQQDWNKKLKGNKI